MTLPPDANPVAIDGVAERPAAAAAAVHTVRAAATMPAVPAGRPRVHLWPATHRGPACGAILIALTSLCLVGHASAATANEINATIDKAKEFLYRHQNDGTWERENPPQGQIGGVTALVTHALLAAGEKPTDPRLARAIAYLRKSELTGTYAMAERLQVYHLLPRTPEVAAAIKKDTDTLIASMGGGKLDAAFRYVSNGQPTTVADMSCSNYGALGIWAAAESDYEVPTAVWKRIDALWRRQQKADGGWAYYLDNPESLPNVQLTAAGIATLYVTTDYIGRVEGLGADSKRPKLVTEDPDIRRGTDWMIKHWEEFKTAEHYRSYYGIYNFERVALSSGRRFFGSVDWYASGVDYLMKMRADSGAIGGNTVNTAFSLIFLAYGRAPVVLNKLEYEPLAPARGRPTTQPVLYWHQRPHDAARFARWMGKQAERKLSWQIIDLSHGAAVLHDSPILYITGEQAIRLSDQEQSALRRYCEDGGLILANAENGSSTFTEFIRKLGSKLFPAYEFRELPPTHAIYTRGQFSFKDRRPALKLLGLSNGSRELMLLVSAGDLSKAWEMNQTRTKADCFEVAANIFHYATDRGNPRERGDSHVVLADEKIVPQRTIELARLKYNGNWDPEPGGWRRLAGILRNQHKVELACKVATLGGGELKDIKLAHLTGTTRLTLSDAAREELKQFLANGGLLIVDAAGGSAEFRDSIRPQLAAIAPGLDPVPPPLPADHPIYTLDGQVIKEFAYRRMAQDLPGGMPKAPRLRGIEVSGKLAIFYSEEDLSTALVGQQVGGIIGYAPETATAILRNILLSATRNPPAKGAPLRARSVGGRGAGNIEPEETSRQQMNRANTENRWQFH